MKYKVKFSLGTHTDEIDLTECGFSEETIWDDLTPEEQNQITDPMREQNIPNISISLIEE